MSNPESSSRKVPYDLRPRKQIERRMISHSLQLIAEAGFPISTYRYTGFGAFFFVDFILFRQLLGITDMTSIEHDVSNQTRVMFNKPFADIDVQIGTSTEYLESISEVCPHLLWLDYDGPLAEDHIADIRIASGKLVPGSIIIFTFDVDFDKGSVEIRDSAPSERSKLWFELYNEACRSNFPAEFSHSDFKPERIPSITLKIVNDFIYSELYLREDISFYPLYNFLYQDGHRMLTIGGMITDNSCQTRLSVVNWASLPFIRKTITDPPFKIDLPILTRRERLYIDSHMPCSDDWHPKAFQLSSFDVNLYKKIYRYCPLYAELLL